MAVLLVTHTRMKRPVKYAICETCSQDHPPLEKCPNAPEPRVTALQKLVGRNVRYIRAGEPIERAKVGKLTDAHAMAAQVSGAWYNIGVNAEIVFLGVEALT